jgi:hypothetical protein
MPCATSPARGTCRPHGAEVKDDLAQWWVWLLLEWCSVAMALGILTAAALRLAEYRDSVRRGVADWVSWARATSSDDDSTASTYRR